MKVPNAIDFDGAPFSVIWEVTRACDLRCVHCRADARPQRHRFELATNEGIELLDQIRDLGPRVFVMTGGDPLKRPDLFELIARGIERQLPVAVTPSGTPLLTESAIARMAGLGVKGLALSIDGPTAELHDAFRRQPGSFAWTVNGIRLARTYGLPVQINTTVTRRNRELLPAVAALIEDLGATMWSVFFLVTVGRAQQADQLEAEEYEDVFAFLDQLARAKTFGVRTTAAPHYRRFVLQRRASERRSGTATTTEQPVAGMIEGLPRAPRGVTDGNGIIFISHTGEVYPSGFLPLRVGNVRQTPLSEIYREATLLRLLRDHSKLQGKCGVCEYRKVCGGSRARAYAVSGDVMAEEPLCAYEPRSKP